jgi:hypothetical protein
VTGKAKAAAAAAGARQNATLALSQALPALLRKFSTDPVRVLLSPCQNWLSLPLGSMLLRKFSIDPVWVPP